MTLEQKVTQAWYQDQAWIKALTPLSWVYKHALERQRKKRSNQTKLAVPVVVVGNITVGGTGKTPLIIHLCQKLMAMGLSVGVISRGYGGQAKQYPHHVSQDDSPQEVGDEPLMICQQTGAMVVVDPNRRGAAEYLIQSQRVDLILSDDGMQHFQLPRDLEILVVDAQRQLGNQHLLPAGPMREPIDKLKEADFCLLNGNAGTPLNSPMLSEFASGYFKLVPKSWLQVSTGKSVSLAEFEPAKQLFAIAGIGNPQRFFDTLKELGLSADKGFSIEEIALDDHQAIDETRLLALDVKKVDSQILMTSKDAVKCRSIASTNCWALEVGIEIDESLENEILRAIRTLAK